MKVGASLGAQVGEMISRPELHIVSEEPAFSWTDSLVESLRSIEYLRGACGHCVLSPALALRLRYRAFSNASIAAALSHRRLMRAVEVARCIGSSERTESPVEQEFRNYWRGLNRLEEAVDCSHELTEQYIQEVNRTVLSRGPGIRGTKNPYRITERPGADSSSPACSLAVPHPPQISGMMRDLFQWWSSRTAKELPAPVAAAIFSYVFARIQPFNNGNRQTARLAATSALWLSGYYMNGWWSFAGHVFSPGDRFYEELVQSSQSSSEDLYELPDYTDWLDYFVGGLGASAREMSKLLERVDHKSCRSELAWTKLSRSEHQVLNRCLARKLSRDDDHTVISSRHLQIWFSLSYGAATTRLEEWLEQSFIVPAPSGIGGSERLYTIDPRWQDVITEASEMELPEEDLRSSVEDSLFGTCASL